MSSPSIANRDAALRAISDLRLLDSIALARRRLPRLVPPQWPTLPDPRGIDKPGLKRLIEGDSLNSPHHPLNWHRAAVARAINQPRVREIYFRIKRALWNSPDFAGMKINARRALDVVIELARDEAFPWYLSVSAETVMRLARFGCKTFSQRVRELESMVVTRPARRIALLNRAGGDSTLARARAATPAWPGPANGWLVDRRAPMRPVRQRVIRYRRGTPSNRRRAAWWINYDLLCGTGRVLPCFEATLDTLARPYRSRNHRFGAESSLQSDDGFAALERRYALHGPLPPPGLRAALWDGLDPL